MAPKGLGQKQRLSWAFTLNHIFLTPCREEREANLGSLHFSSIRWTVFKLFEFVLSRQDRAPNGHEAAVMNEEKKKGGENEMRRDKGEEEKKMMKKDK